MWIDQVGWQRLELAIAHHDNAGRPQAIYEGKCDCSAEKSVEQVGGIKTPADQHPGASAPCGGALAHGALDAML